MLGTGANGSPGETSQYGKSRGPVGYGWRDRGAVENVKMGQCRQDSEK